MEEVIKMLNEAKLGFLATVDNGRPRVRPFGFMFEEDGRLYFCTGSGKDVYRQLCDCPLVEYSLMAPQMVTLRISGEIRFTEERDKKEKAFNSSEVVKKVYGTPDNPVFKVFYFEYGTATISDFSGQPPRKIEF